MSRGKLGKLPFNTRAVSVEDDRQRWLESERRRAWECEAHWDALDRALQKLQPALQTLTADERVLLGVDRLPLTGGIPRNRYWAGTWWGKELGLP